METTPSSAAISAYSPSRPMCSERTSPTTATSFSLAFRTATSVANFAATCPNVRLPSTKGRVGSLAHDGRAGGGVELAVLHGLDIAREVEHAMRVHAAQVGFHEGVGHPGGVLCACPGRIEDPPDHVVKIAFRYGWHFNLLGGSIPPVYRQGQVSNLPLQTCTDAPRLQEQRREDEGDDGHELDENVERRAGRVLEGVADGVADDDCLVLFGALAAVRARLERTSWRCPTRRPRWPS